MLHYPKQIICICLCGSQQRTASVSSCNLLLFAQIFNLKVGQLSLHLTFNVTSPHIYMHPLLFNSILLTAQVQFIDRILDWTFKTLSSVGSA